MIIGIFSIRHHRYHPNRRLLEAAKELGHRAILVNPKKIFLTVHDGGFRIDHLDRPFQVDVILPRMGSTIKEYPLTVLRHFELLGVRLINNYDAIMLARNKFLTLQGLSGNGIPIPESRYISNWSNFIGAVSEFGGYPLIMKTASGRQGEGVFLVESMDRARSLFEALLNRGEGLLLQRYIPPEKRRDIRAFVAGDVMIGAMSLTPRKGDFRANVHLHARTETIPYDKKIEALAVKSTRALGLDISGVDMIEERTGIFRVVDVNYSPGFRGLEKCTGVDVASEIIQFVVSSAGKVRCR
ncbi:MAG: RimK family alpha-L-glutamate ligase [Pseudomonadota bacterium]